jgi:hypothetical protein
LSYCPAPQRIWWRTELKKQARHAASKKLPTNTRAAGSIVKQNRASPIVLQAIAYTIIVTAVVLSWIMTPVPVAAGFTILAVVRVGIAIREARREAVNLKSAE